MHPEWIQRLSQNLDPVSLVMPQAKTGGLSSVLIPMGWNRGTQREEIVLTKRTTLVDNHKGQVSFPGGFWETHDPTLVDTALRESHEEIGAQPRDIKILGALAPVLTHQGVPIYPWVGWLQLPYPFQPNPAEVDRILLLPIQRLLEEGLKPTSVPVGAVHVKSAAIQVDGELVWGATARILEELRMRLINSK